MIAVSSGERGSISLEIFLKSILSLNPSQAKKIHLFCERDLFFKECQKFSLSTQESSETEDLVGVLGQKFFLHDPHCKGDTPETKSFLSAIDFCEKNSKTALVTLPCSKSRLIYDSHPSGHTDFLRRYFQKKCLPMIFFSDQLKILLLTDHTPLKDVSQSLDLKLIVEKVSLSLQGPVPFQRVIFSGINPHSGEGGQIGTEDTVITKACAQLSQLFPKVSFAGPYSGDTLLSQSIDPQTLYIYAYHDQGLAPFKTMNKLLGINLTLGLPFLRASVDHGTGKDISGKFIASEIGQSYVFQKMFTYLKQGTL